MSSRGKHRCYKNAYKVLAASCMVQCGVYAGFSAVIAAHAVCRRRPAQALCGTCSCTNAFNVAVERQFECAWCGSNRHDTTMFRASTWRVCNHLMVVCNCAQLCLQTTYRSWRHRRQQSRCRLGGCCCAGPRDSWPAAQYQSVGPERLKCTESMLYKQAVLAHSDWRQPIQQQ